MQVYLDNAATTPLDAKVWEAMQPFYTKLCANPSATHGHGRMSRVAIEAARSQIAELLHVTPAEIFFTSGGTESNNMALWGATIAQDVRHVVTSPIEHLSVLQPLAYWEQQGAIQCHFVQLDSRGHIQYDHLESCLATHPGALVSLMHGNNEIGNINDLIRIGTLCKKYQAIFHCDMVQTMGYYPLDLQQLPVHLATGSAHKVYGPPGVGILFIRSGTVIQPFIRGGAQERNMRGGTENTPGIVGMGEAMVVAHQHMPQRTNYIRQLKQYMMKCLRKSIPDVQFNGDTTAEASLATILNVSLAGVSDYDMLLAHLDIYQAAAAAGSACTSGSPQPSHVLQALGLKGGIRFSFSHHNTTAEIDYVVEKLLLFLKGL